MKNSLKFLLSSILFFFISHNNILGKDKPIIFMVLDSGIVKIQTFPETLRWARGPSPMRH